MLTLTLRKLERDGLLIRTVYATVPPRVEYSLTDMARELNQSLATLTAWAGRHQAGIAAARIAYDSAQREARPPTLRKSRSASVGAIAAARS
jgi:DNA-binding HxlR family transcriptional regulator